MERTVQQITQDLIDRLPENSQYYSLNEFRSWNFPSFVIHRIKVELERNLSDSMIIPKTDWANTKSEGVRNAWQQFVEAIRAEARLPASYSRAVLETVVADLLDILVQPRKSIPGVVFDGEEELEYTEVHERLKAVVVYPHFAKLISRYMQKKELDILTKERCAMIVKNADQRLTQKYSPLNWAQLLEPLFSLTGGTVDTNLFRLFFEDKNRPRVARKFDLIEEQLTRAQFIEVLTAPDLLNMEGYETPQSALFEESNGGARNGSGNRNGNGSGNSAEGKSVQKEAEKIKLDAGKAEAECSDDGEDSINTHFTETEIEEPAEAKSVPESEPEDTGNSLNAAFASLKEEWQSSKYFSPSEPETEDSEDKQGEPDKGISENEGVAVEQEQECFTISPEKEDAVDQTHQEEETPMWMRFMSEEELAEHQAKSEEEETVSTDSENENNPAAELQEPVTDLAQPSDNSKKLLANALSDKQPFFVKEIFRGSERAYEEALAEIASCENWQQASKFIQKDIFQRNLVDMYSEAAVDFTDRLHGYFLKKENSN